jgi:hypothetical protein
MYRDFVSVTATIWIAVLALVFTIIHDFTR